MSTTLLFFIETCASSPRANLTRRCTRDRVEARDTSRQFDVRRNGFDGNVPFVAGRIPVKLIVVVEEAERVEDAIANDHSARRIVRIWHVDFEFRVTPLAGLAPYFSAWPSSSVMLRGSRKSV